MTLNEFFQEHSQVALAFSGGVDSAFLLYSAIQAGAKVTAYYVKSAFQPEFELEDARKLACQLGAEMKMIPVDILCDSRVAQNSKDRCYYCKQNIFSEIQKAASSDGYTEIIDGTNASDDCEDRPGMRALKEMKVLSPLRLCSLTKAQIRRQSQTAGLFTWNKPAYACLATRIPAGEPVTAEKLHRTEIAEEYLFSLGFQDFRVRSAGDTAKLQMRQEDLGRLMKYREQILSELKKYYRDVLLDLDVRK